MLQDTKSIYRNLWHFLMLIENYQKKKIPFTFVLERIKYLEINLTKEVNKLHTENCKTLMK